MSRDLEKGRSHGSASPKYIAWISGLLRMTSALPSTMHLPLIHDREPLADLESDVHVVLNCDQTSRRGSGLDQRDDFLGLGVDRPAVGSSSSSRRG